MREKRVTEQKKETDGVRKRTEGEGVYEKEESNWAKKEIDGVRKQREKERERERERERAKEREREREREDGIWERRE